MLDRAEMGGPFSHAPALLRSSLMPEILFGAAWRSSAYQVRMPSHRRFSRPAALDPAVGAITIGGNTRTGAVPTDSAQVHTNLMPVRLITLFGKEVEGTVNVDPEK